MLVINAHVVSSSSIDYLGAAILGEMSTSKKSACQEVNLPKKVNSLKTPNIAFWLFYAHVDFWASWLFGRLTFWRLTISPSIGCSISLLCTSLYLSLSLSLSLFCVFLCISLSLSLSLSLSIYRSISKSLSLSLYICKNLLHSKFNCFLERKIFLASCFFAIASFKFDFFFNFAIFYYFIIHV